MRRDGNDSNVAFQGSQLCKIFDDDVCVCTCPQFESEEPHLIMDSWVTWLLSMAGFQFQLSQASELWPFQVSELQHCGCGFGFPATSTHYCWCSFE